MYAFESSVMKIMLLNLTVRSKFDGTDISITAT